MIPNSVRRAAQVTLQQLEARRLLSSSLVGGVLTVTGDAADNTISVTRWIPDETTDQVIVSIDGTEEQFDTAAVQNLIINAGAGNDTVAVGRIPANNRVINGDDGGDVLAGSPLGSLINGGGGDDSIVGGSVRDSLNGDTGSDTLRGNGGQDLITGGEGSDLLDGGSGNDNLQGNRGDDTLIGGAGFDVLLGQGGTDSLTGGTGGDQMNGGPSPDTLRGEAGDDLITDIAGFNTAFSSDLYSGGSGTDDLTYRQSNAAVTITTGDGMANDGRAGENDNVAADFERFGLTPFDDMLDLTGDAGRHTVQAVQGNDTLIGGPGADNLNGDVGDDSIVGGGGEDQLRGGAGDDTIVADDHVADIVNGGDGNDTATVDSLTDTTLNVETVT